MNYIQYCKNCIIPETRPNTEIGSDGLCSACRYFKNRENTNWELRKKELLKIIEKYKHKKNSYYDCIVPF